MVRESYGINKYVVKKDNNKFAKVWLESLIDRGLKHRGSITQPKRHYTKLIMTMMGAKCCLANIEILHQNLMVPLQQIQVWKPLGTSQLIQYLIHHWNRNPAVYRKSIKGSIVHTKSSWVVTFLDQQNRGQNEACARSDYATLQHGFHLQLDLLLLKMGILVWPYIYRF